MKIVTFVERDPVTRSPEVRWEVKMSDLEFFGVVTVAEAAFIAAAVAVVWWLCPEADSLGGVAIFTALFSFPIYPLIYAVVKGRRFWVRPEWEWFKDRDRDTDLWQK